jgi:hypothetical protein
MKKIIRKIYFKSLHNGEHFQLHWSIITFLITKIAALTGLESLWNDYKAVFDLEDIVYKHHAKADETPVLRESDAKRDSAIRLIRLIIEAALLSDDPEVVASAKVAYNVFENYKDAYNKSYSENSALATNLVGDLRSAKYASHVARIPGLQAAVDSLDEKNIDFETLYNESTTAQYDKKALGSMVTIRPKVDAKFRAFADAVEVLFAANELGAKDPVLRALLITIIDTLNSYIDKAELVYHHRAGIRKAQNKPNDDNTPGIPSVPETPDAPDTPDSPDAPDTPDTPEPSGPPHFEMTNQAFYGESAAYNGYASHMSVEAVYPSAFNLVLNPAAASGAILRMTEGDYTYSYPIVSLTTVDSLAGLSVTPPSPTFAFFDVVPNDRPPVPAEVVKDGVVLAILEGIVRPVTVGEG